MNQLLALDMMLLRSHVRIAVLVNLLFKYHRQESVDGATNCRDLLENGRAINFLGDDFFAAPRPDRESGERAQALFSYRE